MYRQDYEPWRVSGRAPRLWVERVVHGSTLNGRSGRIRIFRTISGAQVACDQANAERHKLLTNDKR